MKCYGEMGGGTLSIIDLKDVPAGVSRSQGCGYGRLQQYQTPEEAADNIKRKPETFPVGFAVGPTSKVGGDYVVVIRTVDLPLQVQQAKLNYGTMGTPPAPRKAMKEWPHDCPRCKRRECAIELATTWDCRYGCFK